VKIYHAVGNYAARSDLTTRRTIKSTHTYFDVVGRLKAEGYDVELTFFSDVPNKVVRFYQAQADIVVDMLTLGWFGANVREALMLGKPVVCFLRPEWLARMRDEIPDFVDELPVVSATPETVYDVLRDLIEHPEKRRELGARGRAFALKWFAAEVGARRFDQIYSELLGLQAPASPVAESAPGARIPPPATPVGS
jgi:glycosyltransferase involved in cell wall biosynthesis